MIKFNLDKLALNKIIKDFIKVNTSDIVVFYNDRYGKKINKEKIFKLIYLLENKITRKYNYFFYNIPFCLFKQFGRKFIDNHCIRNKLCNYYKGYIAYDKCNRCRYGLFCNNFNENIVKKEVLNLDGFYDSKLITRDVLLNKLILLKSFFIDLGYKEKEISFYITQKYVYDFLFGKIDYISEDYFDYLIIYVLVNNNGLSSQYFEDINSGILIFNEGNISEKFNKLLKSVGFSINIVNDTSDNKNLKSIIFKGEKISIDKYFSIDKYYNKKPFFDFNDFELVCSINVKKFKGKVYNFKNIIIETKFKQVKNANDALNNKQDIYFGKDLLLGNGINKYKGIVLTTDNLGDKGRFISSKDSIKIPVIYDVQPNILKSLKNGDKVKIDFFNGIIEKI